MNVFTLLPLCGMLLVLGNAAGVAFGAHDAILARWPRIRMGTPRRWLALLALVGASFAVPPVGALIIGLALLVGAGWVAVVAGRAFAEIPGVLWMGVLGLYAILVWASADDLSWTGPAALLVVWAAAWPALVPGLIRRGKWRAAYVAGACLGARFGDRVSAGMRCAVRALRPRSDAEALRWLEARVPAAPPLGPMLLCRGLLAVARRDADGARKWLLGILELPKEAAAIAVRQTAAEWLCVDAAAEGRWEDVAAYAEATRANRSLRFWRLAARCVRDPAARPTRSALRGPLADRLLALPPAAPPWAEPVGFEGALARHLTLLRMSPHAVPAEAVRGLAAAWDAAEVPDAMREEIEADLRALVRAARFPLRELQPPSPSLERAARRLHQDLHTEVTAMANACKDRREHGESLSAADAWMEWMTLRTAYEHAKRIGGAELATLLWPAVHIALNARACRSKKPIDHPIFRWLSREAMERQDDAAVELETRNAKVTQPTVEPPSVNRAWTRGWIAVWVLASLLRAVLGPSTHNDRPLPSLTFPTLSPSVTFKLPRFTSELAAIQVDGLRVGMSEREVVARLGRPAAIERRVWRYRNGQRVEFAASRRVTAVQGGSVERDGKVAVRRGDRLVAVVQALGVGMRTTQPGSDATWTWRVAGQRAQLRVRMRFDRVLDCALVGR